MLQTLLAFRHNRADPEADAKADKYCEQLQHDGRLLATALLDLLYEFSQGQNSHLPAKKLTLLLWKTVMVTYGDLGKHLELKAAARVVAGLPPAPAPSYTTVFKNQRSADSAGDKITKLKQKLENKLVIVPDSGDSGTDSDDDKTEVGGSTDDEELTETDEFPGDGDDEGNDGDDDWSGRPFNPSGSSPNESSDDPGAPGAAAEVAGLPDFPGGNADGPPPIPPRRYKRPTTLADRMAVHKGSLKRRSPPPAVLKPKVSKKYLDEYIRNVEDRLFGYYDPVRLKYPRIPNPLIWLVDILTPAITLRV